MFNNEVEESEFFLAGNAHKADFNDIYSAPDPRSYYSVLCGLNYVIPDLARDVIAQVIARLEDIRGRPIKVVDLGCSYGINAALARFPIDLFRLAKRYSDPVIQGLSSSALEDLDRHYFSSWPRRTNTRFIGVDVSSSAINYAKSVGLLDEGVVANYEERDPTDSERDILRGADLVVTTGCIGYATERTIARLFDAIGSDARPWALSFVLRMFPFDAIDRTLSSRGIRTRKLPNVTFVQRRFRDEIEYRSTVDAVRARGCHTTGKEDDGLFHAELFVSVPEDEVDSCPLDSLFSVARGADRQFGRRFRRVDDDVSMMLPY